MRRRRWRGGGGREEEENSGPGIDREKGRRSASNN